MADNSTSLPTPSNLKPFTKLALLCALNLTFSIVWVICIYPYLSLHKSGRLKWGKLPQFCLFDHARHGIKYYFSTLTVLNGILIPITVYMFLKPYPPIMLFALLNAILTIGITVFSVIVALFVQVFQVMMAWELTFGSNQEDQQVERSRKIWIRVLYVVFIIKDILAKPALVAFQLRDNFSLAAMKIIMQQGDMEVLKIMKMVDVALQLLVPVALILHLIRSKSSDKNILKRLILLQATIFSLVQLTVIILVGIIFFMKILPVEECLYLFQLVPSVIPIIIMITTVIKGRGKVEQSPYQATPESAGFEPPRF